MKNTTDSTYSDTVYSTPITPANTDTRNMKANRDTASAVPLTLLFTFLRFAPLAPFVQAAVLRAEKAISENIADVVYSVEQLMFFIAFSSRKFDVKILSHAAVLVNDHIL